LVAGDVLCVDLIYHVRLMVVFVDRESFTPENIQLIARDLPNAHTLEDLRIDFVSSEEQLGSKMDMLGDSIVFFWQSSAAAKVWLVGRTAPIRTIFPGRLPGTSQLLA